MFRVLGGATGCGALAALWETDLRTTGADLLKGSGGRGLPGPRFTAYYFFFAVFFFAAFFLAFFFAAIIVSFKVNLGMLRVRWLLRTPIARFLERCISHLFHRSPEKISEKACVVRQFYATAQKKSNTFVNYV
jgi:hypothetical protein